MFSMFFGVRGETGGEDRMKSWIVFWNILLKDMRTSYLKPPNVSWGIVFSLA